MGFSLGILQYPEEEYVYIHTRARLFQPSNFINVSAPPPSPLQAMADSGERAADLEVFVRGARRERVRVGSLAPHNV